MASITRVFRHHVVTRLPVALLVLMTASSAVAFQGPYASIVTGDGGFALDLDVRWPDGPPPPGGWPVVFWAHGAGGSKLTLATNAARYADDDYVTLAWTNRSTASNPSPETLAADIVALKMWLVNDFQTEAGVTAPVDPARFGMTGGSLGGYTSWSGGLLSNSFATIVPFGWGISFFTDGIVLNGAASTGSPAARVRRSFRRRMTLSVSRATTDPVGSRSVHPATRAATCTPTASSRRAASRS